MMTMSKVIFILTFFWFDRVVSGKKNAEYRRQNKFWETKLAGLKAGDKVLLRKGYSHTYLEKTVAGVELVRGSALPELERNFFKPQGDEPFYKVVFL